MVKTNPDHCPHISFFSEKDKNGVLTCDDLSLNKVYYNFTKQELNLFQKAAVNNGFHDIPTVTRLVPKLKESSCIEVTPEDILPKVENEFDSLDVVCYGYLQANQATSDKIGLCWIGLVGFTLLFRLIGAYALRKQAYVYK
mmetsp:Transcript_13160/g.19358  ORF Transcript_13160/g.19358 Transcript_13160/m.19358 type:complete len:141 (-) Transcript_13160:274-696(-)